MRSSTSVLLAIAGVAAGVLLTTRLPAQQPPAATPAPGTMKVVVVDVQRAVMETEDGLRAQATLKKYFDRRQGDLDGKRDELLRRKDEIEKQSKVLSKEALVRAMEEWQRQMNELQAVFMDYNKEIQRKQGDVTAPIYAKISGLLRKVAKRDGYDLVLERQAVPYVRSELDITDQIIAMYNAGEDATADVPAPREAPSGAPPVPAPPPAASAPKGK
jgi:outer membrane protein